MWRRLHLTAVGPMFWVTPHRLPWMRPSPSLLRHLSAAKLVPDSSRTALQKIFAIWIGREGELDRSVVENLFRNEGDKFLNVLLLLRGSWLGRCSRRWEWVTSDLRVRLLR